MSIRFAAVVLLASGLSSAGTSAEPAMFTVAADGAGDFGTVQAAIDAIPVHGATRFIVRIKPGTYKGKVTLPRDKPFVTFQGEDAKTTILTNDWNARHPGPDGKEVGTGGSCSVKVESSDFVAENITFENTAGDTGQAVALSAVGDRQVYRNCRLLGWQDTLYANNGRQYYDQCYVEGRVDFIFGNATAVFDRCHLHSKNGGHVTAASTAVETPWGFVFLDCKLTGDTVPWKDPAGGASPASKGLPNTDLGRPWRPYASVTYVRCEIGGHVVPQGWSNWRNAENEKTARYAEYQCTGPGADRSGRVPWSKELSERDGERVTISHVLGGPDHWITNRGEVPRP